MILRNVRIAYPHLFTPRDGDFGKKFEISLMIPKTDAPTIQLLANAIAAAKSAKFGDKDVENFKNPVKDGDTRKQDEFKGHWIIEANSYLKDDGTGAPGVVRPDCTPARSTDIQSGDICNVDVSAGGYDNKGNRGVKFYINNVQLIAKGDLIGGGKDRPEAVFEVIETDMRFDEPAPAGQTTDAANPFAPGPTTAAPTTPAPADANPFAGSSGTPADNGGAWEKRPDGTFAAPAPATDNPFAQ